jgi:RNA recognition motif-containing protein
VIKNMADTNLYIGNLPWDTTKEELMARFAQYGEVRDVRIITDKATGRSRGFGFVEFTNAAEAQLALSENGRDFGGRPLRVNIAHQQRKGRPRSGNGNGQHRGGGNSRGYGGGRPLIAYGDEG